VTATRAGLRHISVYVYGRPTLADLRKQDQGGPPWTSRRYLGVKGSQVQILSSRRTKVQVKGLQLVLSPDGSRGYPNGYPDQRDYHRSTCVTTHSPPAFSRSPAWRTR